MALVDLGEMRSFKEDVRELEQLIDTAIMLDMDDTLTKSRQALADLRARHQAYVDNFRLGAVGGFEI